MSVCMCVCLCITPHCVPCGQINSLPDSFPVNLLKQKVSVLISLVQCLASSIYLYSVSLSLSHFHCLSLAPPPLFLLLSSVIKDSQCG